MRIRSLLPPLAAALAVAVAGEALASGPTSAAPPSRRAPTVAAPSARAGTVVVHIHNFAYSPEQLTVRAGTKITFINLDQTAHTATSSAGPATFDTGTLMPGQSRTITLTKPGRYSYYCQFHAFMTATVTVTG